MQDQIDAINGRIEAINSILLATLPHMLTKLQAAQAVVDLAISKESARQDEPDAPAATVAARETILDGYINLLSVVRDRQ
jgi:hypothetical protein